MTVLGWRTELCVLFSFLATLGDTPLKVHGALCGTDLIPTPWTEWNTSPHKAAEPVSHWPLLGKAGLPWPTPIFKCVIGIMSDLGHQSLNLILTHPTMAPISGCCFLWLVLWHLSEALLGFQELVLGELHPSRATDFLWHYWETWLLPRLFLSTKPWVEALEILSEMERRWGSGLSSPGAQNHDSFNWANWGTWPPENNDMVRSLVTISCVWSHTFTCKWNYI